MLAEYTRGEGSKVTVQLGNFVSVDKTKCGTAVVQFNAAIQSYLDGTFYKCQMTTPTTSPTSTATSTRTTRSTATRTTRSTDTSTRTCAEMATALNAAVRLAALDLRRWQQVADTFSVSAVPGAVVSKYAGAAPGGRGPHP